MKRNQEIIKEINCCANEIPLECKERVLELMKAMQFTKDVMLRKDNKPKQSA